MTRQNPSPCEGYKPSQGGSQKKQRLNFPDPIIQAVKDYAILLRKGYPDKRTLELVADRYHLDRAGRAVLFRGVFREGANEKRQARVLPGPPAGKALVKVDVLNQLYAIGSYLSGQLVFIASDGLLRDASGYHGELLEARVLQRAVQLMLSFLEGNPALEVELYLDSQADSVVSVRQAIQAAIRKVGNTIVIVESDKVDALLSSGRGFILASSDSTIIDRTENPVFDLAHYVLTHDFSAKIPEIAGILAEIL